ncbi:hypothetical protein BKA62DRAFT_698354 [Auriculariales sp. MPI-PUGE-AT-0066]|nr:hypothetical protein BKA62DRAFT_698354 [Auriculariales sp. MPI-PUGE-AT-0066]
MRINAPQSSKVLAVTAAENHARAFKKLARPFRSPIVSVKMTTNVQTSPQAAVPGSASTPRATPTFKRPAAVLSRLVKETSTSPVTTAYRSPVFKSPSIMNGGTSSPNLQLRQPTVLTIQMLERRVQLLKRVIKIKHDDQESALEVLAAKWRVAARTASWDLWDCVKNGVPQQSQECSRSRFDDDLGGRAGPTQSMNWGWDDAGDDMNAEPVKEATEEQGVVEAEEDAEDEPAEQREPTLGKMLIELGIAPQTLGWDESEGDFSDSAVAAAS